MSIGTSIVTFIIKHTILKDVHYAVNKNTYQNNQPWDMHPSPAPGAE